MHLISYISDHVPTTHNVAKDLYDIEGASKRNNIEQTIKGVLFYRDGQFLQIIEGVKSDLHELMDRIKGDPRHENIEILVDTPVYQLRFREWNMNTFQLGAGAKVDRAELKKISERFTDKVIPQSDVLLSFYNTIMNEIDLND